MFWREHRRLQPASGWDRCIPSIAAPPPVEVMPNLPSPCSAGKSGIAPPTQTRDHKPTIDPRPPHALSRAAHTLRRVLQARGVRGRPSRARKEDCGKRFPTPLSWDVWRVKRARTSIRAVAPVGRCVPTTDTTRRRTGHTVGAVPASDAAHHHLTLPLPALMQRCARAGRGLPSRPAAEPTKDFACMKSFAAAGDEAELEGRAGSVKGLRCAARVIAPQHKQDILYNYSLSRISCFHSAGG